MTELKAEKCAWVVGRRVGDHEPRVWRLRGVYTTQAKAEKACTDKWMFFVEVPMNGEKEYHLPAADCTYPCECVFPQSK